MPPSRVSQTTVSQGLPGGVQSSTRTHTHTQISLLFTAEVTNFYRNKLSDRYSIEIEISSSVSNIICKREWMRARTQFAIYNPHPHPLNCFNALRGVRCLDLGGGEFAVDENNERILQKSCEIEDVVNGKNLCPWQSLSELCSSRSPAQSLSLSSSRNRKQLSSPPESQTIDFGA